MGITGSTSKPAPLATHQSPVVRASLSESMFENRLKIPSQARDIEGCGPGIFFCPGRSGPDYRHPDSSPDSLFWACSGWPPRNRRLGASETAAAPGSVTARGTTVLLEIEAWAAGRPPRNQGRLRLSLDSAQAQGRLARTLEQPERRSRRPLAYSNVGRRPWRRYAEGAVPFLHQTCRFNQVKR